jgi:hypothetical protein
VILDPAVDALPRMPNWRWRGQAFRKVLHLYLAIGALVECIGGYRIGCRCALQGAQTR